MRKSILFATVFALLLVFAGTPVAQAQAPVHLVTLTWSMSPDQVATPTLAMTYNAYRLDGACPVDGSYPTATALKIASGLTTLIFTDTNVKVAQTYCYAVTAALNGQESAAAPAAGTIPLAKIPVTVNPK